MDRLRVFENNNLSKNTFVGSIAFDVLSKYRKLTWRTNDSKKDEGDGQELFYQRHINDAKTKKIVEYIYDNLADLTISEKKSNNGIIALFPTAIIVSLEADMVDYNSEDDHKKINKEKEKKADEDKIIMLLKDEIGWYFYIPTDYGKNIFIVDGQHRIVGIESFRKKYPDLRGTMSKLKLPITILLNYGLYEQAQVFANVNFEQKPVNRSLYYDIFGAMPGVRNKITFSHFLAKYLNQDEDSVLRGMIKMLGNEKDGIISQAFMVQNLIKLTKNDGKIFNFYFKKYKKGNDDIFEIVLRILKIYFSEIKKNFIKYYPVYNDDGLYYRSEYKSILFKTTGVGALLRLLNDFDKEAKMFSDNINYLNKYFSKTLSLISDSEAKELFSGDGDYAGGSGGGQQLKLYHRLKAIIDLKTNLVGEIRDGEKIIDARKTTTGDRERVEIIKQSSTESIPIEELETFKENLKK